MAGRYGLEIRSATSADATGLSDLLAGIGPPPAAPALAERIEAVRQNQGAVLLALECGPPSGVIALSWRPTLMAASPIAQIALLFVAPDMRRRGVGRLLLKAGAQVARTAGCAALQVSAPPGQVELEGFCRATGFSEDGTLFGRPLRKGG